MEDIQHLSYSRPVIPREFSQNLQHFLWDRESGYNRRNLRGIIPGWHMAWEREFYKSLTPNLTVQNVDKPLGYMRKFTPDGRLLLSFSADQRALEVYEYQGVGRVAELLQQQKCECVMATSSSQEALQIRQSIYEQVLKLRWTIPLASEVRWHLNREFSIFLENGHYVLLAAMAMTLELPPYQHIFQYPDLYDGCELYTYIFYLVDLHIGCIVDLITYRHDCIMLSHNHGVSAHGHTIAVLSKYRQCIDLIQLVDSKLVPMYSIGTFGTDMDEALFQRVYSDSEGDIPIGELPLTHLKQRVLTHLYRSVLEIESDAIRTQQLKNFYKQFRIYAGMIISKLQLIDAQTLLMRYEARPNMVPILGEEQSDPVDFKLYVFYSIATQKIIKVFPQNSIRLLYMLRNFCDKFRNVRSLQTCRPSSSPSNNPYFHATFNSAITSMPVEEAAQRFNPTLPISTQSFSTSPYLDYSLFNYDDRLISALERPKICTLEPIRFSDRTTNITKFRLFLESPTGISSVGESSVGANRELVAFIFHPYEPFIISIQKLTTRYVINFHIHNKSTVVTQ